MFPVGKQRAVWTVRTAMHSANISFPKTSQERAGDDVGPFSDSSSNLEQSLNKVPLFPKAQFSGSQLLS